MKNFSEKTLKEFILVSRQIPKITCEQVIQNISSKNWGVHYWAKRDGDTHSDTSQEFNTHFSEQDTIDILVPHIKNAIAKYFEYLGDDCKFGIGKISTPRINRYDKDKQMLEHVDHIHSVFDNENSGIPILSIVGCLNEDYESGQFTFGEDYEVKLGAGDILVFPSIFMYPHKVNKITAGTRYSFVCWAY